MDSMYILVNIRITFTYMFKIREMLAFLFQIMISNHSLAFMSDDS